MFKYLKKVVTKNIWVKIFCFLSATVLWIYIAAGQNTLAKYPGSIKIKAINIPTGLVAIYDVKTVDVKIMAEPSVWSKLSIDSFSAYIDLSGQQEGTYELPVNVVSSTAGVDIVEKTPDKIIVSLEQIVSKEVTINKKIEGSAAEGLVAGNIDLEPTATTIRGPKSVVNNITEATVLIKLNGESEKFTKTIEISAIDEQGEMINNVEFDPPEVVATVALVKASNNKTVGVKVKTTGSPKDGYFLSDIIVSPSTVDVTGASSLLANMTYIETEALNLTNQSGVIEKDLGLTVKNGLAIQIGSAAKVHVKITLAPNIISKELTVTIVPLNLNIGYAISAYDPIEVKVICSGPQDAIQNLKSSDVVLSLDFTDKHFSDPVINFNIVLANIKAPSGIDVVSVMPSSINVTVKSK